MPAGKAFLLGELRRLLWSGSVHLSYVPRSLIDDFVGTDDKGHAPSNDIGNKSNEVPPLRNRKVLWIAGLVVVTLGLLYLGVGPNREVAMGNEGTIVLSEKGAQLVSLKTSPLTQIEYVDAKGDKFKKIWSGPTTLTIRKQDGTLESLLLWRVVLSGQVGSKTRTLSY